MPESVATTPAPNEPDRTEEPKRARRWASRAAWMIGGIVIGALLMLPAIVTEDQRLADANEQSERIMDRATERAHRREDNAEERADDREASAQDAADEMMGNAETHVTELVSKAEVKAARITMKATADNTRLVSANADLRTSVKSLARQVASKQRELRSATRSVNQSTIDGDGTYLVGQDIQPGTWRATAASDSCYWAMTDSSGELLDNHIGGGPQIASVSSNHFAFETSSCGAWRRSG